MDKKKLTACIARYLMLCIVAAIVGLTAYSMIASDVSGDSMPMPLGFGVSVVMSGSMEGDRADSLSVGDIIIISPEDEYNVGEVVVYQTGGSAVVHRVVSVDGTTVIAKGDANNASDNPFSISDIKGKVIFSLPYAGYIVLAVKNPIFAVVIIILTVFILERSYRREKEEKEKELEVIKNEIRQLTEDVSDENK